MELEMSFRTAVLIAIVAISAVPRRRRAALIALRVSGELRNMAGSGRGPWHLNAHFKSLGLPSLIEVR